jgi:hypothetical protein
MFHVLQLDPQHGKQPLDLKLACIPNIPAQSLAPQLSDNRKQCSVFGLLSDDRFCIQIVLKEKTAIPVIKPSLFHLLKVTGSSTMKFFCFCKPFM